MLAAYAVMALLEEQPKLVEQLQVLWVDAGYNGDKFALSIWLMLQARVEVMNRIGSEFEVLPRRWVVERTALKEGLPP